MSMVRVAKKRSNHCLRFRDLFEFLFGMSQVLDDIDGCVMALGAKGMKAVVSQSPGLAKMYCTNIKQSVS